MRQVDWTDKDGWKRRAVVRDEDADADAPGGIQLGPPDVRRLDLEGLSRDLHNRLFELGLFTWQDVQRAQNALTGVCQAVLKRRVVALYREPPPEPQTDGGE